MQTTRLILVILIIAGCTKQDNGDIRVENNWIAEIPPVLSVTAALMTLHNDGDGPRYLIRAASPKAASIEIHRSIVIDDLAKMIRQEAIKIPAGGRFEFSAKSGYHLMFYGTESIKKGQKIPVSLHFRDGGVVDVIYEVLDRRERAN